MAGFKAFYQRYLAPKDWVEWMILLLMVAVMGAVLVLFLYMVINGEL